MPTLVLSPASSICCSRNSRATQARHRQPNFVGTQGSEWIEIRQPEYHTRGPAKMYSIACFNAIGELDRDVGWDTLDETRAMLHGFHTRGFRHITARHHRPQGTESGWKARMMAGLAAYRVGYSPLFMIARAVRETFSRPSPFDGALLLAGFLNGYLRGERRCAEPELVNSSGAISIAGCCCRSRYGVERSNRRRPRVHAAMRGAGYGPGHNDAFSFWKLPQDWKAALDCAIGESGRSPSTICLKNTWRAKIGSRRARCRRTTGSKV